MRPLEDAAKNGWEMADFSVMMVGVDLGPQIDRKDRLIVRSAVIVSDSSLSTIRRTTPTLVSTMIIHRRLIEQNLHSYRPLRPLPFMPALCRARLQLWLAQSD
ncbi:hypothetical protein TNCV_4955191 [Trichonephila clavipes]|nr:hypothetical protein TNCV_4955191 [Trichonephila clavipes]